MRKQTAIYWAYLGESGLATETYSEPVELACRWTERSEMIINDFGEEIVSKAMVYLPIDAVHGSYLKLGTIDSATPDDPTSETGAWKVITTSNMPNIKATEYLKKAFL